MTPKVRVTLINGSAQELSLNHQYATFVNQKLLDLGAEVTYIQLAEADLPIFTGFSTTKPDTLKPILETLKESDAIFLFAPEYHHLPPAILKNFFEHIPNKGPEAVIVDKPIALASASTSQFGGLRSQTALLPLFRTFSLWLVPDEVMIPRAQENLSPDGQITNQDILDRLTSLSTRLLQAATLLKPLRN